MFIHILLSKQGIKNNYLLSDIHAMIDVLHYRLANMNF